MSHRAPGILLCCGAVGRNPSKTKAAVVMLWSILTTCRSNPPPPPPAPAVNHQPGGVCGGGCRGWFIQGSRLPRIVPFLTVPPEHMTRFSPTNFSHFTRLSCCTHVTSEHFGKDERLFLAFGSCGEFHFYILCTRTC